MNRFSNKVVKHEWKFQLHTVGKSDAGHVVSLDRGTKREMCMPCLTYTAVMQGCLSGSARRKISALMQG
jgi:hypothetical protein